MGKVLIVEMSENESSQIADILLKKSIMYDIVYPYKDQSIPSDYSVIIISGGIPSISEIKKFPFLNNVISKIKEIITKDISILGICLGHQIIAAALGGRIERGQIPEIGFTTIKHKNNYIFKNIKQNFLAYEFHFDDVVCLPKNIEILATDSRSIIQSFKALDKNLFGVQFHPEVKSSSAISNFKKNSEKLESVYINMDNIINTAKYEYDDKIPKKVIENFLELCNLC